MDPSNPTKYDDIYANIAAGCGGIQPLLDSFFGFLSRRTDFYVAVDDNVKSDMGFPKGVAKAMLLKSFEKYPMQYYSPPSSSSAESTNTRESNANSSTALPAPPLSSTSSSSSTKEVASTKQKSSSSEVTSNGGNAKTTASSSSASSSSKLPSIQYSESGKQIPIGNGGIADTYYWSQTLKEATVYVDVPSGTRGKQINCIIDKKSLILKVNDVTLIEGALDEVVRTDESLWNLNSDSKSGRSQVIITLEKTRPTWWSRIIVGHPEIDCTKVSRLCIYSIFQ